jgi:acyl dehydratase
MTSHGADREQRLYFEDLHVGQRFDTTSSYTVSEAQIKAFATQFDPQPFHLDAEAGRATVFGGLVASGWHTAAITMRLVIEGGPRLAGGTVGLGAEVSWLKPVRPGDTLTVHGEVLETTPSRSRPNRGRVKMRTETRNQLGDVVQVLISKVMVPCRSREEGA